MAMKKMPADWTKGKKKWRRLRAEKSARRQARTNRPTKPKKAPKPYTQHPKPR